jgi:hypothetical protein
MATPFQIVVDCVDPHAMVRFWVAAARYERESNDVLIRKLLEAGVATDDDVTTVDGELAWRTAAAARDPDGRLPRLLFQSVPEPKTAKNRVHLDLFVGEERVAAEVERLIGLGATRLWEGQQGPSSWITMADPEGNEFCVA